MRTWDARKLYCYALTNDDTGEVIRYHIVSSRSSKEAIGCGMQVARRMQLTNWTVTAHEVSR